jgi:2-oxoglutarate-dependent dioxygenase
MPCIRELCEIFERDGIVELGQVLDAAQVADLRARLDALCLSDGKSMRAEVRDLGDLLHGPSQQSVMQRVNLYRLDAAFRSLVHRSDLLDLAEAILRDDIHLFRDQCFYKPPMIGGEVYMHQDNRYWHLDPPSAVVVFVALDDCTVETGCVHYIKGSHRWGRVEHVRAREGKSILLEARANKETSVPVQLAAGHATMHHCQILHWSPPNRSTKPRRAHTIEYVAAGVRSRGVELQDAPLIRARSAALAGGVSHV